METNKEGDVTLSVVMPAYNEGAHITDNLLETNRVLSGFVKRYEIIAVDDGSADNTAECIRRAEMQDTHIRGISYQPNGGKGHAIRTGIAAAEGRYIAFLDSDLELPPILLKRFLKDMKEQDADIVIGSMTVVLIGLPWWLMTPLSDRLVTLFANYLPGKNKHFLNK